MGWLVHTENQDYLILDATEHLETRETAEFLNRATAIAFLQRFQEDHYAMSVLRRLASDRQPGTDISTWDDANVFDYVAAELVSGRLRLGGEPHALPSGGRRGGTDEPEEPEEPEQPPEYSCGQTRWIDASKYCGDNARLECTITGGPPDGSATVEILHPTSGSVIQTISAQLTGGRVEATWVAKAQTANWRTDQIRFRVRAAGLTCTSSNAFTFRARPTTGTINQDFMRGCPNGSQHRTIYDLKLEANRVLQTLKIQAWSDPAVPQATRTAFQVEAESRAQTVWNNGFRNKKFHRHNCRRGASCNCTFDCCKAGYRLDVRFVSSGQHRRVKVIPQPNPAAPTIGSWCRYDDSEWGYPAKALTSTYAHETGHMLGLYDEYVTTCNDSSPAGTQYRQPAPPPASERNLMSTSGNTRLLNRHYVFSLRFLNAHTDGDVYDIIPAGP